VNDERTWPGAAPVVSPGLAQPARAEEVSCSDAEVVCRAQAGDRDAFGELYRRYVAMVHGILLARVHWAHVDDLAHDVFLTVMNRIGTLRHPGAFAGWLCAIARNRATDHARRAGNEVPLDERVAGPDEDRSEALVILEVLRTLPETYRETLVLRLVEGMTGPEIASRTGMTSGSVRVNLHRGMRLLRERLNAAGITGEPREPRTA
jgi:RNA polymerase sigma-70 factor (ECF subfamily)